MSRTDIAVLVLGAACVLGIGYVVFLAPVSELGYRQIEVTGSHITATALPSYATVDIDGTIVEGGFVTIHESMGGAPATIIGVSRYYAPGDYNDASITVAPAMTPGSTYIALLHVDDGDEVFEERQDMPVTNNGQVVRWDFVAGE